MLKKTSSASCEQYISGMISDYLYLVYANCKALYSAPDLDKQTCRNEFKNVIAGICTQLNLSTENELLQKLLKLKTNEAKTFLHVHPFLEIFYLINTLDEINADETDFDALGRFKYTASYQKQHTLESNRVLKLILSTCETIPFLKRSFTPLPVASGFFLSHDIDSLYGSSVQDGLWAIKNFRFDVLLKLFANAITQRPHWFNIDLIMAIESEHDFRSTFYWLVNQGRIDKRQTNADYAILSPKLQTTLKQVQARGFENGLHKSISTQSIQEEAECLQVQVIGNRYHYLKFKLPEAYKAIETSGLKLDASLGFAEQFGFRNAYSFPFSPYNFENGKAFSFLEVPLTIMDGTFQRYMKLPVENTANRIIDFFEEHKQNALISVLWHNTFFTNYKYKGYLQEYKKILAYLHASKLRCLNQTDILKQFSWTQH
ncbi:MAG: hypothetical protein MUF75_04155 [Bacteroidia bacterium]|nr:hypothetical protein [Bacteroidia bacterium]